MRSSILHPNTVPFIALAFAFALLAACGDDPVAPTPQPDTGWDIGGEFDTGGADADPGDTVEDTSSPDDTGPDASVPDVEEDTTIDPTVPVTSDYILCSDNLDCPINGSTCVKFVPLNRTDLDGATEVAVSDVFEGVAEGEGVCSQPCSTDPTVCNDVRWPDDRGNTRSSRCLLIATGAPPYVLESIEPFEATVNLQDARLGTPFAALCMPPFEYDPGRPVDFCAPCDAASACSIDSACFNMLTGTLRTSASEVGQSFCLEPCTDDATCPQGFECTEDTDDGSTSYCVPAAGTCRACVDHDEDGFGAGHCGPASARQTPHDCDDSNPAAYFDPNNMNHPFPTYCGAFDYNCDGIEDSLQQIGTAAYGAEHCTACGDTCSGEVGNGVLICESEGGAPAACAVGCAEGTASCGGDPFDGCPISKADTDYLYFQDADGDGFGDILLGAQFFCTPEEAAATLTNPIAYGAHPVDANGELLLDCDDGSAATYPGAPELCNGINNSCNGVANDADPTVVGIGDACIVPGLQGICAAGQQICTNNGGTWGLVCNQTVFPATEVCDGRDNDCNGIVDDVATIGDACTVSGRLGECAKGNLACNATSPTTPRALTCNQTIFPTLEQPGFDGIDHSCDGFDRYMKNGQPHVVYVTAQGATTLNAAIAEANACTLTVANRNVKCDVFVQASASLSSPRINLANGVDVYGGFDINTWEPSNFVAPNYTGVTPASRVTVNAAPSGNTIGMSGSAITAPTHVYGLEIRTGDSIATCSANYAFQCDNCPALRLRQVVTNAGAAGPGQGGTAGTKGADAPNPGEVGGALSYVDFGFSPRAPGGSGAHAGGASGDFSSRNGLAGAGPLRGTGGTSSAQSGQDGGGGVALPQPGPTNNFGVLNWTSGTGALSCDTNATGASGGNAHGSGGGGAYLRSFENLITLYLYAGAGGGGHSGTGGTGGYHAGPSVGFALGNTAGGIEFHNTRFSGGRGGTGGSAGAGGQGGRGGNGATATANDNVSITAAGGGYGAGGNGGTGGNGGLSIGLLLVNSTVGASSNASYQSGTGGQAGAGGTGGLSGNDGLTVPTRRQAANGTTGPDGNPGWACNVYDTNTTSFTFGGPADLKCTVR